MGYISNLLILPDYKTGIFVSTTNDPYYNQGVAEEITFGIWDILTNTTISEHFSDETICSKSLPPLTTNYLALFNCTVEYNPHYESILGVFKHPTFDDIIIDYDYDRHEVRWHFGSQGSASLCSPTEIKPGELLFAIKIDSNSSLAPLNYDQLMFAPYVVFVFSQPNEPYLVMSFFEPRANPPPVFFKS